MKFSMPSLWSMMVSLPLLLHSIILLCTRNGGELSLAQASIEERLSSLLPERIVTGSWSYSSFVESYGGSIDLVSGFKATVWNQFSGQGSLDEGNLIPPSARSEVKGMESWFYDSFLEAYGQSVDLVVDMQTQFWNMIPRYKSIKESNVDGMCYDINTKHFSSGIPKFLRDHLKEKPKANTSSTDFIEFKQATNSSVPNGFQYDREEAIDHYLALLADGCSKDIEDNNIGAERFQMECLDVLRSLVYDPRCTTRYDSRVKCNGKTEFRHHSKMSATTELIDDHFGDDSLNIVIIGAGPIGLLLANALTMLPQRQEHGRIPPIQTLVVESRADADGLKKAYSRNWQAQLELNHFRDIVDPRLTKIFASMTEYKDEYEEEEEELGHFVLPLNAIETLLLLSNRDMDATKFLFGIDQLELVEDLKDVPNLILVDATGHRLEPLRRGAVCDGIVVDSDDDCEVGRDDDVKKMFLNHRTPPQPDIPWLNNKNRGYYESVSTFNYDLSEGQNFLSECGHALHVAQNGDVMYPFDMETKAPKTIYWIDIHGATLTEEQDWEADDDEETENLYANDGALCDWCRDWFEEDENEDDDDDEYDDDEYDGDEYDDDEYDDDEYEYDEKDRKKIEKTCNLMCYSNPFASSMEFLREDIIQSITEGRFNDTFVFDSEGWFPLMGYSFNPSEDLAHKVEEVLDDHGYRRDPVGMPLRDFYAALQSSLDATEISDADLDVVKALKRIYLHSPDKDWPTITLDVQRPFIYTNGLKKKKKCKTSSSSLGDHLDAPMIRVGDSLTTGDGLV